MSWNNERRPAFSLNDTQSLAVYRAREALFHDYHKGFILYLSGGKPSSTAEERVLFLEPREALIWLNAPRRTTACFIIRKMAEEKEEGRQSKRRD